MAIFDYYFSLTPHLERLLRTTHVPEEHSFYIAVAVPALLWVGFALWGARRAEIWGRSFTLNFILGMALPIIYPLTIPAMIRAEQKKRRKQRALADAAARNYRIPLKNHHRSVGQFVSVKPGNNQSRENNKLSASDFPAADFACVRYFSALLHRQDSESGAVALHIEYGDDEMLKGERILEVLPHALVVQTWSDALQAPQSVRIPYTKISCVRVLS